jgi:dephospho-CoA kinase
VASGKSTVARLFAEAGIAVIDADAIARELRAPGGRAYDAIMARFGTADPSRLREIVFSDAVARSDLEAIMHPLIREESTRRIYEATLGHTGAVPVIYEAALLVETGRYRDFAGLIVVSADEETRMKRLMARDQSSEALARKIIAAQIADIDRQAVATFVIENHGSVDELRVQVQALLPKLS